MFLQQEQKLKIVQKVTPQIITTQKLLQIPTVELFQEIEREIEENPALELEEGKKCPFCGVELKDGICLDCGYRNRRSEFLEYIKEEPTYSREIVEEDFSSKFFSPPTLREYLHSNYALISSDEEEKKIADILVENINEYGYLTCEISSISSELRIEVEKIEKVLKKIQSIEPVGIGSRDIKESLLVQIEYLEKEGETNEIAEKIVQNHLVELSKHKYEEISKELDIDREKVDEAVKFIQENLTPHPGLQFKPPVIYDEGNTPRLIPDVIVDKRDGEYIIEVVEFNFNLRINPYYLKLYEELRCKEEELSPHDEEHIKRYLYRAKLFIKSLSQRKETLYKITKEILTYQREFFETKERKYLKPLTQAKLAEVLNLSESTLSRATNNKYIQLPWKEIVPFSLFFDTSLGIKKKIYYLIKEESIHLKDHEIVEILKKENINISRRTVAKYREELNIPPYNLRKEKAESKDSA